MVEIEAVCFDLGDTLIDEETVKRDSKGFAITANLVDGAMELLRKLKGKGYKLAIICNGSSRGARALILSTGINDFFDVIVISEEVGSEKPDERIFLAALEKLKIDPKKALMIGNRILTDILGANKLGMLSVLFKWNDRYPESSNGKLLKPKFTINKLDQVLNILNEVSG
jgi:putative hydrolase of the HAD superfamily